MPHIKHKLGTALKIESILNIDTATTAMITIKDPNNVILTAVNDVAMTKDVDKVYFFIWQSAVGTNVLEGQYKAIISITSGGFTGVSEIAFLMEKIS